MQKTIIYAKKRSIFDWFSGVVTERSSNQGSKPLFLGFSTSTFIKKSKKNNIKNKKNFRNLPFFRLFEPWPQAEEYSKRSNFSIRLTFNTWATRIQKPLVSIVLPRGSYNRQTDKQTGIVDYCWGWTPLKLFLQEIR